MTVFSEPFWFIFFNASAIHELEYHSAVVEYGGGFYDLQGYL